MPEWYEPDSENIGHGVSKTVIKHWVESNARLTPNHRLAAELFVMIEIMREI